MNKLEESLKVQHILQEIDRLIGEMVHLRGQVSALKSSTAQAGRSVRERDYFGMWADREDMEGQSAREWLEYLRVQQWTRY
ncbi:MAG: hypothetical protein L6R45_33490 [Anaerolineae bacterium]|nr:hypothetical protein [Anaerolineae bacterium]